MKIKKLTLGAIIPTMQYGNISPVYELEDIDNLEGTERVLENIKSLFNRFSDKGSLKDNLAITSGAEIQSFNEDISVNFDPITHTYLFNGKQLVSATGYIERFYKEFDTENISKASAKSWGVGQEDVKNLWSSNGNLTSEFGNVVHKALELSSKYEAMGNIVSKKKELEENYAMPKHPILKAIVKGFIKINKTSGIAIPEALITDVERGYCGHADRILITDEKKKICRIQDYKVNINSEEISSSHKVLPPFNELPSNKISKYQLQMSFYANMLEKTGWKVEGLDVFVYEDSWKHFALPVLKVI